MEELEPRKIAQEERVTSDFIGFSNIVPRVEVISVSPFSSRVFRTSVLAVLRGLSGRNPFSCGFKRYPRILHQRDGECSGIKY